jgi:hypothetical protein
MGLVANESPRSKLRGITELNFEDFSEAEANPVASYGECSSSHRTVHQTEGIMMTRSTNGAWRINRAICMMDMVMGGRSSRASGLRSSEVVLIPRSLYKHRDV